MKGSVNGSYSVLVPTPRWPGIEARLVARDCRLSKPVSRSALKTKSRSDTVQVSGGIEWQS